METLLYLHENGMFRDAFCAAFDKHPLAKMFRRIASSGISNSEEEVVKADVVVTGLKLPGTTGLEVIKAFRQRKPNGVAILVCVGSMLEYNFLEDVTLPPGVIHLTGDERHGRKRFSKRWSNFFIRRRGSGKAQRSR